MVTHRDKILAAAAVLIIVATVHVMSRPQPASPAVVAIHQKRQQEVAIRQKNQEEVNSLDPSEYMTRPKLPQHAQNSRVPLSRKLFALIDVDIPRENLAERPQGNYSVLNENTRQYCARHDYHYIRVTKRYPLFGHTPCSRDLGATQFPAVRTAMFTQSQDGQFLYEWVLYKQHNAPLVNLDIRLERIAELAPSDTHMIMPAVIPGVTVDTAVMFRNSAEGRALIQELIDVQMEMHSCSAPGMSAIMEMMLRRMSNTPDDSAGGMFPQYNKECLSHCNTSDAETATNFAYQELFECFYKWARTMKMMDWSFAQKKIPGIWMQPASGNW